MKKKLFVFLTVVVGGLFLLLYNPLKEFVSNIGEVEAAETDVVAAEEYSELEKFLLSEESGTYKLTKNETITHELNLSFTTKTTKTIDTTYSQYGPGAYTFTIAADVIVGNNCGLIGFHYIKVSSSNGKIIMKENGSLAIICYNGPFDLTCIKCDSSFYGNISISPGNCLGTLTLDYGANLNVEYASSLTLLILEANFSGTIKVGYSGSASSLSGCISIQDYLGPKYKIPIIATNTNCYHKNTVQLGANLSAKFSVVPNLEEMAYYLVRKPIPKPTASETIYEYNGEIQTYTPAGFDPNTMNITNNTRTEAGTQYVTISLKDTSNQWSEGGNAAFSTIPFTINKANINPTVSMIGYAYGGTKSNPSVSGNLENGSVTYYYNTSDTNTGGIEWSEVTSSTSLDAGTYYMYAVIEATTNYNGATTETIPFTIKKAELTLTLTVKDQTTTYSGSPANPTNNYTKEVSGLKGMDHIDVVTIGGTAVYKYSSGSYTTNTVAPTNVGNYVIGLSGLTATADNYTITTVKYIDGVLTIEPKNVTVEFSNYENLVYNKGEQEITVNLKGVFENDTCTITGITGNKGQYAGDYTCEVTEISNPNYALSSTTSQVWSIAKYQVEKPKEDTTVHTYTGEEQTYQVASSEFYTASNQTQREAGTYKVTITLNDTANYEWKNDPTKTELEYSFTIRQKAVDIIWSENTFTYNGEEQDKSGIKAYYLSLPSSTKNYLTVKCNSESFKIANTYTFSVELDDTKNYTVANSSNSHSYTIEKASITFTAEDKSSIYKENIKELTYSLVSGTNYDGITPELTTTATTTSNVGTYPITITATNDNYDITLNDGTYTITSKGIEVSVLDQTSSYKVEGAKVDQSAYSTEETGDLGIVITKEAGINVGEYHLTASSTNTNYDITFTYTNGTYSLYTITKAVYHDINYERITVEYEEGLALKDVSLKPGFSFKNPETVLVVDTIKKYDAIYNEDPQNYEDYELKIQVRVIYKKEDPEILTIPEASEITYGEKLESSILSNGLANVEGSFSWADPTQDAETGNLEYEVTFTPTDTEKYNTVTFEVSVRVKKAIPEILMLPEATDILVGQSLDKSSLASGTASVEGSFSWANSDTIPGIGENNYEVVFTPKDTTNYEEVVFEVPMRTEKLSTSEDGSIEVNKDNYEELKEIVDNYNSLTEEEKNQLDPEVKEEIQRLDQAIQEYRGGNNLATVLILSIGVPCGVILIAGIILYVVIRRKRKR